jgi:hypothetical protein
MAAGRMCKQQQIPDAHVGGDANNSIGRLAADNTCERHQ